jgi:hypothetical protein
MPDYNFLSGPLWLINSLHILTLTLHLIAMNFLVGGIVVLLWGKLANRWEDPTVKQFIRLFPTIMAATVTLGVAPLLFLQLVFHHLAYAAAIVSGWFWMAVIDVAILTYYLFYAAAFSRSPGKGPRAWMMVLALIGLLYISFEYSAVFSMVERPGQIAEVYAANQSGFLINPHIGEYIFRWLHMIFGALTVGAFIFGIVGRNNEQAFSAAKGFVLLGTVVNALVGFVYLFQLMDLLAPFMRSPGIHALTLGVLASLALVHFYYKKKLMLASILMFVSMICMVTARHYVRLVRLAGDYDPSTMKVDPQWSIMIVFVICFLLAVGTVWYMLRLFMTDRQSA